jgi:fatty-acyl-CoA synthase
VNAAFALSPDAQGDSAARAWLRALEMTAPIGRNPLRILPTVIEQVANQFGDKLALISDHECLTYHQLVARSNQYARWALDHGLAKGDMVGLFMPNRPEYLAFWLGVTKVGGVVALLNPNLSGPALAHSINIVAPKHLIVAAELMDRQASARPGLTVDPTTWIHGAGAGAARRIDEDIAAYSGEALSEAEVRPATTEDRALCIYTSGTTGFPKAANISHGRLMQWSHWFAAMMGVQPSDRMYNCLPMYHASGGVQAPGSVLVSGGSVVIRDRFSASGFWTDITRWDCTLFQYIGELCRYLVHGEPSPHETQHGIRLACGNGLRPDVWNAFQNRFRIPRIFEFYGATEGSVSLFNIEGQAGAIGRIPPYLAHRSAAVLVKYDPETEMPFRDENGLCVPCATNEAGEAIGPLRRGAAHISNRFEGYTDAEASEKKILRDVFTPGDAWFRTGDLMRKDERGFFYFVDRVGDTFRWKGENVAASEVAAVLGAFPAVRLVNVYGVTIPGTDGRAGMATLVVDGELNLPALREHIVGNLPAYARPLFVRIREELEVTPTFKWTKTDLVRQGYDPAATSDAIYFNHPGHETFIQVDQALHDQIRSGQIRL